MRILSLLFLLTTLADLSVNAVTNQEKFLQANEFYKKGDFQKAYQLYESIPGKGAAVNYNLGNCAYKRGELGLALAHWRRSEIQWGIWNRGELLHNIALVQGNLHDDTVSGYIRSLKGSVVSFVRSVPIFVFQVLFLIIWLFLFIFIKTLYKKKHKILIMFLFLLVAVFGGALALKYSLHKGRYGVVIKNSSELLSGPDEKFSILGQVPEALEVVIKKNSDGFYKIKFNGKIGWIKAEDLIEV